MQQGGDGAADDDRRRWPRGTCLEQIDSLRHDLVNKSNVVTSNLVILIERLRSDPMNQGRASVALIATRRVSECVLAAMEALRKAAETVDNPAIYTAIAKLGGIHGTEPGPRVEAVPPPPPPPVLRRSIANANDRPKVLLIDDHEEERFLLGRLLGLQGFDVMECDSAASGVAAIFDKPSSWDLIVSDQRLGDLLGSDVLKLVAPVTGTALRILCTGVPRAIDPAWAASQGIYAVIDKGPTVEDAAAAIRSAFIQAGRQGTKSS